MSDETPNWAIEGRLYDADDRFWRTSFQDMVLKADPNLDISNVTEILIYMHGHANVQFPNLNVLISLPQARRTPIPILG